MAVFAPGDTPDPGTGDQGGFMSWLAGLPGQAQASILRSMNYANPVQPAAADTLTQGPNPAANPSPVPPALAGGGPPVPPSLTGPSTVNTPIGGGPGNAMQAPTGIVPGGGNSGGAGNNQSFGGPSIPIGGGPGNTMEAPSRPPWFTPSNTPYAPNPAIGAPPPPRPAVSNPAVARGSNRPAGARIPSTATASVPPAGSPFTTVNRPNMGPAPIYDQQGNPVGPVSGGALARGGGPPLMTALDLSRLFGGGDGQSAPAATRPAASIPASATASVPPDMTSNAPWNYGPYQKSVVRTPGQPYGPIYPRAPATSNF